VSGSDYIGIVEDTEAYLRQQKDLFGNEWHGRIPETSAGVPDLAGFEKSVSNCRKCILADSRTHFVFGTGNPRARLMLIGEAPGEEEDKQGKPFVGKAGQLLDKILAAIGFERGEVYIANVLKCRPPGNRDPLPEEMALCLPTLQNQILIIQPKVILLLGRVAAHAVLRTLSSLTSMRGKVHRFRVSGTQGIPVVVTFHPAALLRNPQWKHETWEDVQKLRLLYDELVGDKAPWNPKKKA
jgi:uracil-DNA glycosylase